MWMVLVFFANYALTGHILSWLYDGSESNFQRMLVNWLRGFHILSGLECHDDIRMNRHLKWQQQKSCIFFSVCSMFCMRFVCFFTRTRDETTHSTNSYPFQKQEETTHSTSSYHVHIYLYIYIYISKGLRAWTMQLFDALRIDDASYKLVQVCIFCSPQQLLIAMLWSMLWTTCCSLNNFCWYMLRHIALSYIEWGMCTFGSWWDPSKSTISGVSGSYLSLARRHRAWAFGH